MYYLHTYYLPTTHYTPHITRSISHIVYHLLPAICYLPPINFHAVRTAYYLLPATHDLLFNIHPLLPLLLITYDPLSTTYNH